MEEYADSDANDQFERWRGKMVHLIETISARLSGVIAYVAEADSLPNVITVGVTIREITYVRTSPPPFLPPYPPSLPYSSPLPFPSSPPLYFTLPLPPPRSPLFILFFKFPFFLFPLLHSPLCSPIALVIFSYVCSILNH